MTTNRTEGYFPQSRRFGKWTNATEEGFPTAAKAKAFFTDTRKGRGLATLGRRVLHVVTAETVVWEID